VVNGVGDYGNKLGLATVNGAVLYHPGYTSNPLVYCGCVGIGPRDRYPRQPQAGDRVIVIGGRTGRDGLRGATFSSLTMDAQTGQVAGAAVQIGDPITEKGVIEVVVRARDAGLYTAITDCGAGGLSSAVGEMSAELGVRVDLSCVPLKYTGLAPWEIWLSEAQERMVLAVPPVHLPDLVTLCNIYEVEWSDIGMFIPSGRLQVLYKETPVVDLDEEFLHTGRPQLVLEAALPSAGTTQVVPPDIQGNGAIPPNEEPSGDTGFVFPGDPASLLLALLSHPNLASKETIIRRYDYEVRGATVVKPFAGPHEEGPSDAAVLKPLEAEGWCGFVLANGINPWIGEVDPYAMALSVVDEAIRNAVAVGGDPQRLALLDNFCWGDPQRPEILGGLVRAAQGCHDAALYYGTPFISGKDSLNNEWVASDRQRHAIPGTLLISCIALHPDVRRAITMDLKEPGDLLYLLGDFQPALSGSHSLLVAGAQFFGNFTAPTRTLTRPEGAPECYQALHTAILAGQVRAIHDLSEGGLATAAAEMALAGRLGVTLDTGDLSTEPRLAAFGETNGCLLVEISLENAAAFQANFQHLIGTGGFVCVAIGTVLETSDFILTHHGTRVAHLTVADLAAAFTRIRRGE
jgi:phosphoribosylformylglycinamidine synthase